MEFNDKTIDNANCVAQRFIQKDLMDLIRAPYRLSTDDFFVKDRFARFNLQGLNAKSPEFADHSIKRQWADYAKLFDDMTYSRPFACLLMSPTGDAARSVAISICSRMVRAGYYKHIGWRNPGAGTVGLYKERSDNRTPEYESFKYIFMDGVREGMPATQRQGIDAVLSIHRGLAGLFFICKTFEPGLMYKRIPILADYYFNFKDDHARYERDYGTADESIDDTIARKS